MTPIVAYTILIDKPSGRCLTVYPNKDYLPVEYCNYVRCIEGDLLIKEDEGDDDRPAEDSLIPAFEFFPNYFDVITQEGLENISKLRVQQLADARGYTTVDALTQSKAVMISAFLAEQG